VIGALSGESLRIVSDSDRFQVGDRVLALSVPGEINDILLLGGSDPHHVTRVLLIGGGETAMHVASTLIRMKYDVTLIESDANRAEEVAARLEKCTVIQGDGTAPAALAEHIRDGHEAVVVLVDDDSKSLLAGITAKHHGAKKVIARVINQEYGTIARSAGIDALISPPRAMANSILHFARRSRTVSTIVLGNHIGELIDFEVDEKPPKKLVEPPIGNIKLPTGARIGAILRKDEVIVPNGETTHLEPKDHVFVVALREAVAKVEELFG
jgi:trk system potassium uptake protein TrkA